MKPFTEAIQFKRINLCLFALNGDSKVLETEQKFFFTKHFQIPFLNSKSATCTHTIKDLVFTQFTGVIIEAVIIIKTNINTLTVTNR